MLGLHRGAHMSEEEHEYPICDMSLHRLTPRIRELTGEAPKITLHTRWDGSVCSFCYASRIGMPTMKTVRLFRFLIEGKPRRMAPPTAQREERILWYLFSFVGDNPFHDITQRISNFRKKATGLVRQAVDPILLGEQEA